MFMVLGSILNTGMKGMSGVAIYTTTDDEIGRRRCGRLRNDIVSERHLPKNFYLASRDKYLRLGITSSSPHPHVFSFPSASGIQQVFGKFSGQPTMTVKHSFNVMK